MTKEENLHWLNEEIKTWENECQSKHPIKEALYAARKALEQEPCEDCISRQAAIDAIGEKSDEIYKTKQKGATYPHDDFFQGMAYAENVIKQLPPVQPEKRTEERTETPACDCISRRAAIRIASGYCHPANIAYELSKLPPAQPEQRWIPVSERLPEEDDFYLVTAKVGNELIIDISEYTPKNDFWDIPHEIVAWQPLPKPYTEESEE